MNTHFRRHLVFQKMMLTVNDVGDILWMTDFNNCLVTNISICLSASNGFENQYESIRSSKYRSLSKLIQSFACNHTFWVITVEEKYTVFQR